MPAWRNWYHLIASTYGAWLPGDARGFRTRHHREHIDGDYRQPPPSGKYDARLIMAKGNLQREPVVLMPEERHMVLDVIRDTLADKGVQLLAISVGGMHVHLLGQFPDRDFEAARDSAVGDPTRHFLGIAKRKASSALRRRELRAAPIWGKRCKVVPVSDREHQVKVFQYIMDHVDEGAMVWNFRDTR
jgi:REP element-mobilizing transposase RayT